ncbi:hypothetical protein V8F20_009931 [Naviculisporaceae sp. PSN 640]
MWRKGFFVLWSSERPVMRVSGASGWHCFLLLRRQPPRREKRMRASRSGTTNRIHQGGLFQIVLLFFSILLRTRLFVLSRERTSRTNMQRVGCVRKQECMFPTRIAFTSTLPPHTHTHLLNLPIFSGLPEGRARKEIQGQVCLMVNRLVSWPAFGLVILGVFATALPWT